MHRSSYSKTAASLILFIVVAFPVRPSAEHLHWRTRDNKVDADLETWSLKKVLEVIGMSTGWKVYVEPGFSPVVSTKFQNLPPSEALPRLVGNLNYALKKPQASRSSLYVFSSHIGSATQLVEPPADTQSTDAKGRLLKELVVTMKPGHGKEIEELAKRLGAKIVGNLDGKDTYRLEFENAIKAQEAQEALATSDHVDSVDSNYQIARPESPEPLTMASRPTLNLKPSPLGGSSQVIVGLIDTSVQIQGNSYFKDFVLPQQSVAGEAINDPASLNHGTAMASTILRGISVVADGGQTTAKILPVDVYGANESTTTYDVARGISSAVQNGANIINLSLGSYVDTPYLQRMITDLHSKGVLFVAAAGNEPTTLPNYPAAYSEVVAVTAGDRNGRITEYANRGDFVDIVAPGSSIVNFGDKSFLGSGTSYSSAYIAGVAAGMASNTKATTSEIEAQIRLKLGKK